MEHYIKVIICFVFVKVLMIKLILWQPENSAIQQSFVSVGWVVIEPESFVATGSFKWGGCGSLLWSLCSLFHFSSWTKTVCAAVGLLTHTSPSLNAPVCCSHERKQQESPSTVRLLAVDPWNEKVLCVPASINHYHMNRIKSLLCIWNQPLPLHPNMAEKGSRMLPWNENNPIICIV